TISANSNTQNVPINSQAPGPIPLPYQPIIVLTSSVLDVFRYLQRGRRPRRSGGATTKIPRRLHRGAPRARPHRPMQRQRQLVELGPAVLGTMAGGIHQAVPQGVIEQAQS